MLVDASETTILSNLGWVDRGAIWTYDVRSQRATSLPVGEGEFLRLLPGEGDFFACALMNYKPVPSISVSVRRVGAPADVLAHWDGTDALAVGDPNAWSHVPNVWLSLDAARATYVALDLDRITGRVAVHDLDWFDETYDHGYEQPMSVLVMPDSGLWLFGVQRSSDLVLFDPATHSVVRTVPLADRAGNPHPRLLRTRPELWVVDYDTLVRVDPSTWTVSRSRRLQDVPPLSASLFIGKFAFDRKERRCAIARPFSGDAVVIDVESWDEIGRVQLGEQPLDVALLSDGSVIARDWNTGELLTGRL
jgi:hypothetical protein